MTPIHLMIEKIRKKQILILFFLIGILGVFLRLYRLNAQVVIDDEWHAIYWAVKSPLKDILTHFHEADNCIPLTAYYKLLLNTVGLNEFWLRSPQIFSGILCVIVFPVMVRSIVSRRTSLIFSFLASISPFLIFYSRFARPYIIIVLLSFIALFSFYLWIKGRKKRFLVLYVAAAALAPYFHLPSFVAVTTPLVYTVAYIATEKTCSRRNVQGVYPKMRDIASAGVALLAGWIILFYPTIHSWGTIRQKLNGGLSNVGLTTLVGAANLFNGSTLGFVSLFLTIMFFRGAYLLFRRNSFLFGYLFTAIFLTVLSLSILRPLAVHTPAVFARYSICLLPLWLLFISIALEDSFSRLSDFNPLKPKGFRVLGPILATVVLLPIFLSSPLYIFYRYPNNFTNHMDFQGDYLSNWTRVDLKSLKDPIPQFYFWLRNTP
jgi:uncharacterized membrane protein